MTVKVGNKAMNFIKYLGREGGLQGDLISDSHSNCNKAQIRIRIPRHTADFATNIHFPPTPACDFLPESDSPIIRPCK